MSTKEEAIHFDPTKNKVYFGSTDKLDEWIKEPLQQLKIIDKIKLMLKNYLELDNVSFLFGSGTSIHLGAVSIRNFPKEYKYTLGQDILSLVWKTLDWVILANTVENREKKKYIAKAVSTFNSLKYRFRVASDTEILSHQKYAYIIKQSVEIEKMLKGWFSWSKRF